MKFESKFDLGDLLKEKITNIKGIVVAVEFRMSGCPHYALQMRELKDGDIRGWIWLDETYLDFVLKTEIV